MTDKTKELVEQLNDFIAALEYNKNLLIKNGVENETIKEQVGEELFILSHDIKTFTDELYE